MGLFFNVARKSARNDGGWTRPSGEAPNPPVHPRRNTWSRGNTDGRPRLESGGAILVLRQIKMPRGKFRYLRTARQAPRGAAA